MELDWSCYLALWILSQNRFSYTYIDPTHCWNLSTLWFSKTCLERPHCETHLNSPNPTFLFLSHLTCNIKETTFHDISQFWWLTGTVSRWGLLYTNLCDCCSIFFIFQSVVVWDTMERSKVAGHKCNWLTKVAVIFFLLKWIHILQI